LLNRIIYIRLFEVDSIPLSSLSEQALSSCSEFGTERAMSVIRILRGMATGARKDFCP
jgi:hypothetical protein